MTRQGSDPKGGEAGVTLRVDPAFAALVPPLSPAERAELEASLCQQGCRDPLTVWKGHGILLDGHHRREVCELHGVTYEVVEIDLPDETAARLWVVRNALARRNLTPMQRAELALVLKPLLAAEAKENQRRGGGSGPSGRQKSDKPRDVKVELAAIAGVSHDTIAKVEAIRDRGGPELLARVCRGDLSVNQGYEILKRQETEAKREARREENRRLAAAAPTLDAALAPAARFATIVADPPWRYGGEEDWDYLGLARPEYCTMATEEMLTLPVGARADADCHLYLWVPDRLLPEAFAVVGAWGFRYVQSLVWCKKPRGSSRAHLGLGRYFRSATEHVLFGVKGSQALLRRDVPTWFDAPVGRHSEKPEKFYEIVESCSPGPYLELFARKARAGWTVWGAEAPAA